MEIIRGCRKALVKLKALECYCDLEEFEIYGIPAEWEDFGEKFDAGSEYAEEYCCGDMTFFPKEPSVEILKKYSITEEEYNIICKELKEKLSFGCCGWCS